MEWDELQRRLTSGDQVMLLDVRQPDEFTSPPGHLPGAVNVPLTEPADRTTDLAWRKQPIVVVCKTDRRSARAATELLAAGLRDVAVLSAAAQTVGINAGWHWNNRQHPAPLRKQSLLSRRLEEAKTNSHDGAAEKTRNSHPGDWALAARRAAAPVQRLTATPLLLLGSRR